MSVDFLNDAWNGSIGNGNDRNLYVDGICYDGTTISTTPRAVLWNGPTYYTTRPVARASDFLDTIGVTTHLLYGDTAYRDESLVLASLAYAGIDHVRDGGGMLDPDAVLPFERAMAAGIKFDFTSSTDGGVATEIARLRTLAAADPDGITSIEGINEASASFAYDGLTGQAAALRFQRDLYAAVKADPALASIPVINYTLLSQDPADYTRYGDVSSTADLGNVHLYPYGGLTTQTATLLPRALTGTPQSAGYVITEFGYDTISNAESIQAKYMLDGLLDAFQAGATATYLYELLDDNPDRGLPNVEDHFGIFSADGKPKPAATALHNLTTILADPGAGAFTPGTFRYSVTGLPATGSSLLLAKSDGSFDLPVWAEPLIRASATSPAEIAAEVARVTVRFDRTEAEILVYDPLLGTAPIANGSNASGITIDVTDHPIIIAIQPTAIVPAVVGEPVAPSATILELVAPSATILEPVAPSATISPPVAPSVAQTNQAPLQSQTAVYRFFDRINGTQFLTSSAAERDAVIATRPDLAPEGVGISAVAEPGGDANALAVFRFFEMVSGTHFYTSSATERDGIAATRPDLIFEGASFYEHLSPEAGDTAVYRFFNAGNGTHFYTASASERDSILATRSDLVPEGVAFYAPRI